MADKNGPATTVQPQGTEAWTERARGVGPAFIEPRTELGRRLCSIRRRIEASRPALLDWDALDHEVAERRGGAQRNSR